MFEIVINCWENKELRDSFNRLSEKTFELNFEDWYQNGFWSQNYKPYSIIKDNEVVANVSVNTIDIAEEGTIKHYIQLGTVMTDEKYRNQGLIRKLMDKIKTDFENTVDGIYLFAGKDVINFYPKFGFEKSKEFSYSKNVEIVNKAEIIQVPMDCKSQWNKLITAIEKNKFRGRFDMINNSQLIMFYVSKFMQNNVYYSEKSDTYVIAEIENENLFIHNVFSEKETNLDDIINSFGNKIKKVTLGFTPENIENYVCTQLQNDDTNLFVLGDKFKDFESKKVMFPTLSHA